MKLAIATIYWNSRAGLQRLLNSIPPDTTDYFIAIDGMFAFHADLYKRHTLSDMIADPKKKNDHYNSLDGSTELLKSHFNKDTNTKLILDRPEHPLNEFHKRNRYLQICDRQQVDITHLIIVDTDEFFHYPKDTQGNIEKQKEHWTQFKSNFKSSTDLDPNHNVYSIKCIYANTPPRPTVTNRPRCWFNPGQMRYIRNSHFHFANIYTEQAKINYTPSQAKTRMYCQQSKDIIPPLVLVHDINIQTTKQQNMRQKYRQYLKAYEAQVQQGVIHKEADIIAKKHVR